MIKWSDDYKIGIQMIDEQHEKLFEIANRAYDVLTNKYLVDKYDKIEDVIDELTNYTKYHFKTEEDYMLKIHYKRFLSQKAAHDEIIKKVYELRSEDFDENQDNKFVALLEFIVEWISEHILRADRMIAQATK